MKRGIVGIVLVAACAPSYSMSWADLWSRPDQQTIAQRQQAYTEIQGKQYAQAAQHLEPYKDPVSLYDKGNALAHAGDLKAALRAYDAVLKDPATVADLRRDAQHNRDLVAQQMQSQQSDKSDKSDKGSGDDSKGSEGAGDDNAQRDSKGPQDSKGSPDTKDQKDGAEGKDGADSKDANGGKHTQGKDRQMAQGDGNGKDQPQGEPQADAGRGQDQGKPAPAGEARPDDLRAGDAPPAAQAEQAQSLDQWLRWIPDDPSGLLRRKFMIEHMLNQREGQK